MSIEEAEVVDGTAVEVYQAPPTTLFKTDDPVEVVEQASRVATALAAVIDKRELFTMIQSRKHVRVEGWQLLGSMLGVTAVCVATEPVDGGYKATVEARTADGRVIGRADALCTKHEKRGPWKSADDYARISMAQCVPVTAEILTRRGFKTALELEAGEEVVAYDCDRDMTVWTPLRAVNVFADAPTVRARSRSFDFVCTPDHKWAVRGRNAARLVPLDQMAKTNDIIMAAPLCRATCCTKSDLPIGPRDAAIIGWLLTDGTIRQPARGYLRAHIDQSKPYQVEELRALLGTDVTETVVERGAHEFPSGVTYQTRPAHRFAFTSEAFRAFVARTGYKARSDAPRIAANLSPAARQAMLTAMLAGDGHNIRGGASWRFGKLDPDAFEAFQILSTLEGRALGIKSSFTMTNGNMMLTQVARVNRVCRVGRARITPHENQPVWCPTTEFGTWVMRYRGNVAITGNTRATSKALKGPLGFVVSLAGYESTPAEEMTFAAPEQTIATLAPEVERVNAADIAELMKAGSGLTAKQIALAMNAVGHPQPPDLPFFAAVPKAKAAELSKLLASTKRKETP